MKTIATIVGSALLGGLSAIGASSWLGRGAGPAPAPAPSPAPVAPSIVVSPPGGVRLHLGGGPFDGVRWDVASGRDLSAPIPLAVSPDGSDCEPAVVPGPQRAIATYLRGGKLERAKPVVYTVPDGPAPPPDDPPAPPTPAPVPGTIGDGFFAVAVVADLTHTAPASFYDVMLGAEIHDLGGTWLKVNAAKPPARAAGSRWLAAATSHGLPALVLVRKDGSVFGTVGALPDEATDVITAVKAAKGTR